MAKKSREFDGYTFEDNGHGDLYNAEIDKFLIYRPYPLMVETITHKDDSVTMNQKTFNENVKENKGVFEEGYEVNDDGSTFVKAEDVSKKVREKADKEKEMKKENPYATNNNGGSDDNSSKFADEAIRHWEDENKYKEKYGKDDEMAISFKERWEREKKNREYGEKMIPNDDETTDAENYYSKLSPREIEEDLEERKYRLDNGLYDKEDEEMYQKFYDDGKEYYDKMSQEELDDVARNEMSDEEYKLFEETKSTNNEITSDDLENDGVTFEIELNDGEKQYVNAFWSYNEVDEEDIPEGENLDDYRGIAYNIYDSQGNEIDGGMMITKEEKFNSEELGKDLVAMNGYTDVKITDEKRGTVEDVLENQSKSFHETTENLKNEMDSDTVRKYYKDASDEEVKDIINTWENHHDSVDPYNDFKNNMENWLRESSENGYDVDDMIIRSDEVSSVNDDQISLAEELGVNGSEIEQGDDNTYTLSDGSEYIVLDEEEANERAREDIENSIDEMGLDAFSPTFQEWIIDNALDKEWFEEAKEESNSYYVDDIKSENDSIYGNRLIQEAYDAGILTDDDFEKDEDGDPIYDSPTKDENDIYDEYLEYLNKSDEDPVEWYKSNYGTESLTDLIRENQVSLDRDAIVDECISQDGRGHFISYYDGNEIELKNGKYAYRMN